MKLEQLKIIQTLKDHDPVELPMDDMFFNQLHGRIMKEVDKTDIKEAHRLSKTWVFLENTAKAQRSNPRR